MLRSEETMETSGFTLIFKGLWFYIKGFIVLGKVHYSRVIWSSLSFEVWEKWQNLSILGLFKREPALWLLDI